LRKVTKSPLRGSCLISEEFKNFMIKTAAVIGTGVMGTQIAELLSESGLQVMLLTARSKSLESSMRNLQRKRVGEDPNIQIGNFEDQAEKLREADWIIETVVEQIEIKRSLMKKIEPIRKRDSIISTNTSGIPISQISEGFSEEFLSHFLGTHFFNPLKHLKLLEIVPGVKTLPSVAQFIQNFASNNLGRMTVISKDVPGFIANRIGAFTVGLTLKTAVEQGLNAGEVDELTGKIIGRPKSATFRTLDMVGMENFVRVAQYLYDSLPYDPMREYFKVPDFMLQMAENQKSGVKTKEKFYKRMTREDGKSEIFSLDLKTQEYVPAAQSPEFSSLYKAKAQNNIEEGIKWLARGEDKASNFFKKTTKGLVDYAADIALEIADSKTSLDQAAKWGFGWELGPFEMWDILHSLSLEKDFS
jgi:3-hydroxyacyl-CoA dehydrogenase